MYYSLNALKRPMHLSIISQYVKVLKGTKITEKKYLKKFLKTNEPCIEVITPIVSK